MGANLNLPFGVRVSSNDPIDAERYIVADQAAMDALIVAGRAHEGLMVYNEADKTPYYLEVLGATPALSAWTPLTGGINSGTIIPPNMARVTGFGGNDLTGIIGSYTKPFQTATGAVDACRQAIVLDNALAGKLVVRVELGDYLDEKDLVFAGTLELTPSTRIFGIDGDITFDVTDTAFSGLQNQIFFIQGLGASLNNVTFDHPDQTQRHTLVLKLDYVQWKSAVIASEFILQVDYFEAEGPGDIYLVDSVDIAVGRIHTGASIEASPFIIHPADVTGTLDNNSSTIHIQDAEVDPTGRLNLVTFDEVVYEKHILNVVMESGTGDIVMFSTLIFEKAVLGELILNYRYNLQHSNAINSNTSSSVFKAGGNCVITVIANVTNHSYLQRGFRADSNDNAIVNVDLNLTSENSGKHCYLSATDNAQLTFSGDVVVLTNFGTQVGIYIYAPDEAPFDDVNNASNMYFGNVSVRNISGIKSGFAMQVWGGAKHKINILGSYSVIGDWSLPLQGGVVDYNHMAVLPVSAQMTRDLTVATDGQTIFPSMYTLINERLNVIMNGIILGGDDYSLTTTDLTLGLPAFVDDEINMVSFDANPIIYGLTKWADPGPPPDPLSEILAPIIFTAPPTNPLINAILTGPDVSGDGVLYNGLPSAFDATAYLAYNMVQDAGKRVQLISVRFSARVQDAADTPVTVRVSVSNDNFVSQWDSQDYVFSTLSYVTKEWYLQARLFSPDKNHAVGIQVRVQIFTDGVNVGQGISFNNFTLKGYHKDI